jgi:hypothetical protein
MAELLCAIDKKTGLTRAYTRRSLAKAASARLPYKINVDQNMVTELWPRLEAAVIARGKYVIRPHWRHEFHFWASNEDHAAMLAACARQIDVYRRLIRDLYPGANLDTLADNGSQVEFRVGASLMRSNDNAFVHTFQTNLAQVEQAQNAAIAHAAAEYLQRVTAGLVID